MCRHHQFPNIQNCLQTNWASWSKYGLFFLFMSRNTTVHTEFSQTLNYVHKSPKSDDGSEEISFSLQMCIHRKCFWHIFSLQPKFDIPKKTVKMATVWFRGIKIMAIEIKYHYNFLCDTNSSSLVILSWDIWLQSRTSIFSPNRGCPYRQQYLYVAEIQIQVGFEVTCLWAGKLLTRLFFNKDIL